MKPISFSCAATLPLAPEDVTGQILDLANWTGFQGYGPLPGIRAAVFEVRTPEVAGSRIRVTDTRGTSHVEEIAEWQPGRRVRIDMKEFSPPLSRLATRFVETWELERQGQDTRAVRSFALYPTSALTRPLLWLISLLLRRAIDRHLAQMRQAAEQARRRAADDGPEGSREVLGR